MLSMHSYYQLLCHSGQNFTFANLEFVPKCPNVMANISSLFSNTSCVKSMEICLSYVHEEVKISHRVYVKHIR
jgi:hypothetical protein